METTYKIGEAATLLNLKTYVLRFWETEFQDISPLRTEKGQRLYTEAHLALLERIRFLLHERGLTIEGARKALAEEKEKGRVYTFDPHGRNNKSPFDGGSGENDEPDAKAAPAFGSEPEPGSGPEPEYDSGSGSEADCRSGAESGSAREPDSEPERRARPGMAAPGVVLSGEGPEVFQAEPSAAGEDNSLRQYELPGINAVFQAAQRIRAAALAWEKTADSPEPPAAAGAPAASLVSAASTVPAAFGASGDNLGESAAQRPLPLFAISGGLGGTSGGANFFSRPDLPGPFGPSRLSGEAAAEPLAPRADSEEGKARDSCRELLQEVAEELDLVAALLKNGSDSQE